jgi:hypothetical protein
MKRAGGVHPPALKNAPQASESGGPMRSHALPRLPSLALPARAPRRWPQENNLSVPGEAVKIVRERNPQLKRSDLVHGRTEKKARS